MEGRQNGRQTKWKIKKIEDREMEDRENGIQGKWKTAKTKDKMEKSKYKKTVKTEDNGNGRG